MIFYPHPHHPHPNTFLTHTHTMYKLRDWIDPEKINWYGLSMNPAAMPLLEKHPEKIHWLGLSRNPSIFIYDYDAMKVAKQPLHEQLVQTVFHPKNIHKFDGCGFDTGFQES
jgi:hypothetical protein